MEQFHKIIECDDWGSISLHPDLKKKDRDDGNSFDPPDGTEIKVLFRDGSTDVVKVVHKSHTETVYDHGPAGYLVTSSIPGFFLEVRGVHIWQSFEGYRVVVPKNILSYYKELYKYVAVKYERDESLPAPYRYRVYPEEGGVIYAVYPPFMCDGAVTYTGQIEWTIREDNNGF